jgi:hypothetical protein
MLTFYISGIKMQRTITHTSSFESKKRFLAAICLPDWSGVGVLKM